MVDKYAAKQYVSSKIGSEHINPTIGVWNHPEDIDFCNLPDRFVLKTTHSGGSSGVIICKDKSKLDIKKTIKKLNKSLKTDLSKSVREWPYKNVQRRIIAEKYMEDESGELIDYKFYCFNGDVKCVQVDYDRFTEHHRNIYDTKWHPLHFTFGYHSKSIYDIKKPEKFGMMLDIAKNLSKDIPHVRIDLYCVNNCIYFGEFTFFPESGHKNMAPDEWNDKFGDWLILPSKTVLGK